MTNCCYICKEDLDDNKIKFCNCEFLHCHNTCLEEFINVSNKKYCNICGYEYRNYHSFKVLSVKNINIGINIIVKNLLFFLMMISIIYNNKIFEYLSMFLLSVVIISDLILQRN
jgi:hypothetical protein